MRWIRRTPPARCQPTASTEQQRRQRLQALRRHDWVVYAKTPLAGAAAVLDYLSRYTHRTAIGNERLVAIAGDKVLLRVRADATGGKRTIAIDGQLFIARFLQHVLPSGFKRIRHYGLLAPATKADRLATARALLTMPASNPTAIEDAQAFMRRVAAIEITCCPHCRLGHWQLVLQLPADRAALASNVPRAVACRGPP
jgi:Putative transposase